MVYGVLEPGGAQGDLGWFKADPYKNYMALSKKTGGPSKGVQGSLKGVGIRLV